MSLARALIVEPDTLLLDEPLSNLDANLREEMRFEVRRLHDAYRYTTIYVTHDQSEAMTTADLIAVMNAGRIEQLGTPQEVYDAPRSEFMASFLGGSNIIRGKALDATHMSFAGTTIDCCGAPMVAGADAAVSVRQHEVRLSGDSPRTPSTPSRARSCATSSSAAPATTRRDRGRHAAARHRRAAGELRARRGRVAHAAARPLPRAGGVSRDGASAGARSPHPLKSGHFHPVPVRMQWRPSTRRSTSTLATTLAPSSSMT